jgi:hypothetical protein
MAPLFTNQMQQLFGGLGQGTSWTDSNQHLLMDNSSRSASSMGGSVGYQSQLTMHTSISSSFSTLTSYSVYQIDEDQISLNKDRPLGEGNFGIVFKGVWTKSNGDWRWQ